MWCAARKECEVRGCFCGSVVSQHWLQEGPLPPPLCAPLRAL